MAAVDRYRTILHRQREKLGRFGLRPFEVYLIRNFGSGGAWDGIRGNEAVTSTKLTEANGQNPKVIWITPKEYLMGYPQDVELEVKITAGLVAEIEDLLADDTEVTFLVTGPGFGTNGTRFKRASLNTESALSWRIGLKRVSTSEP